MRDLFIIDAFTTEIFSGNPAAVVPLDQWISPQIMQSVATENNLSETAFLVPVSTEKYEIRWFSPLKEIDFCGHATLASAHVLFSQNPLISKLFFVAKAVGEVEVRKIGPSEYEMVFPRRDPSPIDHPPLELTAGLGLQPSSVLRNSQAYFAVYDQEAVIEKIDPDLDLLTQLAPFDVVVTAPGKKYDFVSRYFWPANGGAEDPVTGSIHAGLAPYWAPILKKTSLVGHQVSARKGIVYCEVLENHVLIRGHAIQYLMGKINI